MLNEVAATADKTGKALTAAGFTLSGSGFVIGLDLCLSILGVTCSVIGVIFVVLGHKYTKARALELRRANDLKELELSLKAAENFRE